MPSALCRQLGIVAWLRARRTIPGRQRNRALLLPADQAFLAGNKGDAMACGAFEALFLQLFAVAGHGCLFHVVIAKRAIEVVGNSVANSDYLHFCQFVNEPLGVAHVSKDELGALVQNTNAVFRSSGDWAVVVYKAAPQAGRFYVVREHETATPWTFDSVLYG